MIRLTHEIAITEYITKQKSIGQIARELGTNYTNINRELKRLEIPIRSIKLKTDDKKIMELYNSGMSADEIGNNLGFSRETILRRLKTMNVHIRSPYGKKGDSKERLMFEYVENGKTIYDIASLMKCSVSTVIRRLSEYQIERRHHTEYGNKHISSPHRLILIPMLERLRMRHITSHKLPKLPGQMKHSGIYEIDEYLPDLKIFLELYGDYWHKRPKQVISDERKSKLISKHYPDHRMIIIWESDLKSGAAEKLLVNIAHSVQV